MQHGWEYVDYWRVKATHAERVELWCNKQNTANGLINGFHSLQHSIILTAICTSHKNYSYHKLHTVGIHTAAKGEDFAQKTVTPSPLNINLLSWIGKKWHSVTNKSSWGSLYSAAPLGLMRTYASCRDQSVSMAHPRLWLLVVEWTNISETKWQGIGLIGFSCTLHNACLPSFAATAANRGRHPVWHSLQWLLEQAVKRTGTTTAYLVRPEHWSILTHSNCVTWVFQWTS